MNYLAHLHLAQCTQTSLSGALLGDFVKAQRWQQYTSAQIQGINLHRFIDTTIDQQLIEQGVLNSFSQGQRRYAGIVLDLYFDHLLCKHWTKFSPLLLAETIQDYYQQLNQELSQIQEAPERLALVLESMQEHNWLLSYREFSVIRHALGNIGKRLKRPYSLDTIFDQVIVPNQDYFEAVFLDQYPWLLEQCSNWVKGSRDDKVEL